MPLGYHGESSRDNPTISERVVPDSPYYGSIFDKKSGYFMPCGTTTSPTHSSPVHFTPSVQNLGYSPQSIEPSRESYVTQGQSTYSEEYASSEKSSGFPFSEWQPGRSVPSPSSLDASSPRAFISDEPIEESTQSYDSTLHNHHSLVRLLTEVLQNLDSRSTETVDSSTNDETCIEDADQIIISAVQMPNLDTAFQQSELFMSILSRYCRAIYQLDASAIFDLAKDGTERQQPMSQRVQLSDSVVKITHRLSRDHPAFLLTMACYVRILDVFDHFMAQPSLSPVTNDGIASSSTLPNLSLGAFQLPFVLRQNLVVQTITHFVERLEQSVGGILSKESMTRPELRQNEESCHADGDTIHELTIKIIKNRRNKILERVKHYHRAYRARGVAPDEAHNA